MRTLLNPKWLLLINAGPLLLLVLLCYGEFGVIHTLLPPASVLLWQQLGGALLGLLGATLLYAGWRWWRGQTLSSWYAGVALLAYTGFLTWYMSCANQVVPSTVPRWMMPTDIGLYVWTFIMPTLAHALLVLVVRSVPAGCYRPALPSLGLALVVPALLWLVIELQEVVRYRIGYEYQAHWLDEAFLIVCIILGPLGFLFFLVRGFYLLGLNREDRALGFSWKIVVSLLLPVLGLAVNGGLGGKAFFQNGEGVFGDFSSPWFYGLAVLNGVLLCWPAPPGRGRLVLLAARSVLLEYTFYFFLVFLPFLPLSLLAVLLIGTGFLMLVPLALLVLHLHVLSDDLAALRPYYGRGTLRAVLVAGAAGLPLALTATYYHDRQVLHAALDYVYSPDYTREYTLDAAALARTLATVRQHKAPGRGSFFGSHQPYLSTYFNWLVLDNLTLAESKITDLEQIFLGTKQPSHQPPARWQPPISADTGTGLPAPRQVRMRSTFDAKAQAWTSWVDLDIANTDTTRRQAEFSTELALPVGAWVGSYYLDIGPRREPGLLAERKAANWVYAQILSENRSRDPGLLTYVGPRRVALRVYPVVGQAVRHTGFQLLHKEPLTLWLAGRRLQLGDSAAAPVVAPVVGPGGGVVYLSAAAKRTLPLVRRRPYYHFLLDVSAGQESRKAAYVRRVQALLRQQPLADSARFSLVNTYCTPLPAGADWAQALRTYPAAGGCYLTGAISRVLVAAQQHPDATYPVLVVVTDSLLRAVLPPNFADLAAAYPEGSQFYELPASGHLVAHSLRQAPALASGPLAPAAPVRAWPTAAHAQAYVADDQEAAIVLPRPAQALAVPARAGSRWETGLLLHGFGQWQALHPEAAARVRIPFIQASFQAGILTPLTAYLALENEAQKAALLRKQKEVLAANASLDADEQTDEATAVPLDDYVPLLVLLALGLGLGHLRRR